MKSSGDRDITIKERWNEGIGHEMTSENYTGLAERVEYVLDVSPNSVANG